MSDGSGYDDLGIADSALPAIWPSDSEPSETPAHAPIVILRMESSDRAPSRGDGSPLPGMIVIVLFAVYCIGRLLF